MYFDHSFTLDKNHKFLKNLKKRGFNLEKKQVEHPGKLFCRFISLESSHEAHQSYLEFVDLRSPNQNFPKAGLSFGYKKGLEKFSKQLQKKMKLKFTHKNYNWKKDSSSKLPGWNFVTFLDSGIRAYHPWITEYEPSSGRRKTKPPKHKNTAYKVLEINLMANKKGHLFYQKLLGGVSSQKCYKLPCGTRLNVVKGSSNSYKSIVLACKDLKKFISVAKPDHLTSYKGEDAAIIKNPVGWDLIIVAG